MSVCIGEMPNPKEPNDFGIGWKPHLQGSQEAQSDARNGDWQGEPLGVVARLGLHRLQRWERLAVV